MLDAYRILTAAHCFESQEDSTTYRTVPTTLAVLAGAALLTHTTGVQRRPVADVLLHDGYISDHDGQDIAIIRLAQPL